MVLEKKLQEKGAEAMAKATKKKTDYDDVLRWKMGASAYAKDAKGKRIADLLLLFDKYKDVLTENQFLVLKKMLSKGLGGYVGGMTAKKYMKITKVSKSTATREMGKLKDLGIFKIVGLEGTQLAHVINTMCPHILFPYLLHLLFFLHPLL